MNPLLCVPPAPVGQQPLPARTAAFDSCRSLRGTRGPLLLTTGTAYDGVALRSPTKKP
jgi:hypothetical protein